MLKIHLFVNAFTKQSDRETEITHTFVLTHTHTYLLSTVLFPKWPKQPEMGQAETTCLELHPCLSHRW